VAAVRTATIDGFIAQRSREPGKKKGTTLSPASVNKDLRHLKAVLKVACEWGYVSAVPKSGCSVSRRSCPTS